MPARSGNPRLIAPPLDQFSDCHAYIGQKSPKTHIFGPASLRQLTHAHIPARNHALEKRRPLLSRRRSPNRPSDHSILTMATLRFVQSVPSRITLRSDSGISQSQTESICRAKMCRCPSLRPGSCGRNGKVLRKLLGGFLHLAFQNMSSQADNVAANLRRKAVP